MSAVSRSRARKAALELLGVLTVVLMVCRNHYDIITVRDVGADDEGWYLASGVLLGKPGFPNGPDGWPIPEQGPLYCLWYGVLSKLVSNPLDLYFANWQILISALSIMLFLIVRRYGVAYWQALLASFFFVNGLVADIWPFPTYFATLIVLLGIFITTFVRPPKRAFLVVVVTLGVAGFARPELLWAYAVAVMAYLTCASLNARRTKKLSELIPTAAISLLPGIVLSSIFGNPLGGTRAFFAFAQHYAKGLLDERHSSLDPWANWGEITEHDFLGAKTIAQAMWANPKAFSEHVFRNLHQFPESFLRVSSTLLDTSSAIQKLLQSLGILFALIQIIFILRSQTSIALRRVLFFVIGCLSLPFSLSCVLVNPRLHYFIPIYTLTLILVFSRPVKLPVMFWRKAHVLLTGAFSAALVFLTASKNGAATLTEWLTRHHRAAPIEVFGDRQKAILYLRGLNLRNPIVTLEYSWGTCFYAGYSCNSYLRWDKQMPLHEFVTSLQVNLLIFDDTIQNDVRFVNDPDVNDFIHDAGRFGFVSERVPGTAIWLVYRSRARDTT